MLDVHRLAEVVLAGTQALIAKELAPLRAENAALAERNAALDARVVALESVDSPDVPALLADAVAPIQAEMAATRAELAQEPPSRFSGWIGELVHDAVSTALEALPRPDPPDLSGFATKEDLAASIEALPPPPDVPDPPDLTPFATKAEVVAIAGEVAGVALAHVVTKDDLAAAIEAIPAPPKLPDPPDLTPFATKSGVALALAQIPPADLSGLATKGELAEVRDAIPTAPDLTAFATRTDVAEAVAAIKMPEVIHGKDGAGLTDARTNDDGELILKLTNGDTRNVGRVVGHNGFSLEDFSLEYDGERNVAMVFARNGRVERNELVLPFPIDRGVWREGHAYERGDAVSFGGSLHIAQEKTEDRPETSKAWRLAVKRGRDMTGAR